MGVGYSVDTSIPPGGALLYVQRMECFVQPNFSEPKPACLSTIPDSTWQSFHSKVAMAASNIWSEKAGLAGLLALPLVLLGFILPRTLVERYSFLTIMCGIVFVAVFLGLRFYVVNQNEKQDKAIRGACSELASATGMSVVYRTQFTGFCKPKGAHPYRAIAVAPPIQPMRAASANQLMNVQVPPGSGPGSTLQVQGPSGQQLQVVVPDGVSVGQTFQIQVPPMVVAATVIDN